MVRRGLERVRLQGNRRRSEGREIIFMKGREGEGSDGGEGRDRIAGGRRIE